MDNLHHFGTCTLDTGYSFMFLVFKEAAAVTMVPVSPGHCGGGHGSHDSAFCWGACQVGNGHSPADYKVGPII